MGNSKRPRFWGQDDQHVCQFVFGVEDFVGVNPAWTPGPWGCNDQCDPNAKSLPGDTPGPVGFNDYSTPRCAQSSLLANSWESLGVVSAGSDTASVPKPMPKAFVSKNYTDYTVSVGDGYCVPLVKEAAGVRETKVWKQGVDLVDKPDLDPGTAIATFNSDRKYASLSSGNHAAIFVAYATRNEREGILIYDQYREWADSKSNHGKDWETQKPGEDDATFKERIKRVKTEFPEEDTKTKDGKTVTRRFRRKQPGERFIAFDNKSGNPSNDASKYSVIEINE